MYLGVDIGTSGVKVVLVDAGDQVVAQATAPLTVSRPRPLWSEQDPADWWAATQAALDALAADAPQSMARVQAIGLSGQMLGVALIDQAGSALRPAMLWNDGRAAAEGVALEQRVAGFADITGARPMPGFSAPKLLWLHRHEPDVLRRAHGVLLPKDYVRLCLTGELASDRADASATLLMDTQAGTWHDRLLETCGLDRAQMPRLVESGEHAGTLRPALARRWGLPESVPVAGGAGDNMCGGVGAGVVRDGDAYISLGTSGVYFVANERFAPSRGQGMHTHRHAVPGLYCQQAVVLSAAGALTWILGTIGATDVDATMRRVEAAGLSPDDTPVFTPYLAGERTPQDDPSLTATFSRLTFNSSPLHLVQAVMEGVALALADCHDALLGAGATVRRPLLIGGGTRSALWARLIASALGVPLAMPRSATIGPALGAARRARVACGGVLMASHAAPAAEISPDPALADALARKRALYRAHSALKN
jgi:xylulokinase